MISFCGTWNLSQMKRQQADGKTADWGAGAIGAGADAHYFRLGRGAYAGFRHPAGQRAVPYYYFAVRIYAAEFFQLEVHPVPGAGLRPAYKGGGHMVTSFCFLTSICKREAFYSTAPRRNRQRAASSAPWRRRAVISAFA